MERGLYDRIRRALRALGRRLPTGRHEYTDAGVLEVYLWAALHDRPVCWACDPGNWAPGTRRGPMPDPSTVSRRMREPRMFALVERLRRALASRERVSLLAAIDGKALPVGAHSHDRQARCGRAPCGMARGYKLHAVVDTRGRVLAWRLSPMSGDERAMARRMLRDLRHRGYLVADANYDANYLFDLAHAGGAQLVTPRRGGAHTSLGHRRHSPHRLRCRELLETDRTGFGAGLCRARWLIERFFGTLTSAPGGLPCLPAWVRTWRRVRNWVGAKLIIYAARAALRATPLVQ